MSEHQKAVLRENRVYLEANLNFEANVVHALYHHNILHQRDNMTSKTEGEKFRFLLEEKLLSGSPTVFDTFCMILACEGYPWMAAHLKVDEVKKLVANDAPDDRRTSDVYRDVIQTRYLDVCRAELLRRQKTCDCRARFSRQMATIVTDLKRVSQSLHSTGAGAFLTDLDGSVTSDITSDLHSLEKEQLAMEKRHAEMCLTYVRKQINVMKARPRDGAGSPVDDVRRIIIDGVDNLPETNGYRNTVNEIFLDLFDVLLKLGVQQTEARRRLSSAKEDTSLTYTVPGSPAGSHVTDVTPRSEADMRVLPSVVTAPLIHQPQGGSPAMEMRFVVADPYQQTLGSSMVGSSMVGSSMRGLIVPHHHHHQEAWAAQAQRQPGYYAVFPPQAQPQAIHLLPPPLPPPPPQPRAALHSPSSHLVSQFGQLQAGNYTTPTLQSYTTYQPQSYTTRPDVLKTSSSDSGGRERNHAKKSVQNPKRIPVLKDSGTGKRRGQRK